jgi:hypothetical protein
MGCRVRNELEESAFFLVAYTGILSPDSFGSKWFTSCTSLGTCLTERFYRRCDLGRRTPIDPIHDGQTTQKQDLEGEIRRSIIYT